MLENVLSNFLLETDIHFETAHVQMTLWEFIKEHIVKLKEI